MRRRRRRKKEKKKGEENRKEEDERVLRVLSYVAVDPPTPPPLTDSTEFCPTTNFGRVRPLWIFIWCDFSFLCTGNSFLRYHNDKFQQNPRSYRLDDRCLARGLKLLCLYL